MHVAAVVTTLGRCCVVEAGFAIDLSFEECPLWVRYSTASMASFSFPWRRFLATVASLWRRLGSVPNSCSAGGTSGFIQPLIADLAVVVAFAITGAFHFSLACMTCGDDAHCFSTLVEERLWL
jgi:hypothetical protein